VPKVASISMDFPRSASQICSLASTLPTKARVNRRRGIHWHLFQVQLVSIVPIGLFAATLLYFHWQAQEHERQRSQMETVRLLAAAVDNALDSTVERLSIFARLWSSSSLSEQMVHAQAKEALGANADWSSIVAFDTNGRGVFRTDAPFGPPVQANARIDVWRPVFSERRPVISDVLLDATNGAQHVAVGVPVLREGRATYVLIAQLKLGWYDRLMTQQGQPDGAVAGLVDRTFKFVARSSEGEERRGADPTPQWVADLNLRPEGIARYTNLNGTAVYTAWTFTRHGWAVGFGTPSAPVDNAFWDHLLVLGLVWAAAVAIGLVHAFSKARVIAASLESLEAQAEHVATGRRIEGLPDSHVAEVNRPLVALEKASASLQSAMQERDRSFETEREARAAAEAANQAKDAFLAMLGHELRNPLAAIVTAATIVKSERRSAEQLEFATGVIERQGWHLKRIIDDLLDVGRATTGKIVIERKPVDLAAAARHAVLTLQTAEQFDERRVELDSAPAWIEGDQTRIEQILNNLLVNAARYTGAGGRIAVRVARDGDAAVLRVSDDGEGIAAEDLSRVFELFFQAPSATNRAAGGLGIGLTLVRRLARLHGGEASAHSDGRGTGAVFTVRLPAIEAPQLSRRDPVPLRSVQSSSVLLVEDNADARASLAVALELRGYHVLQSGDGTSALDALRKTRPPVAVFDVALPDIDGYELARCTRAEFGQEIMLIALTGYGTERDAAEAMRAGFDRHLTKPVDVKELVQVIELGSRSRAAATEIAQFRRRRG